MTEPHHFVTFTENPTRMTSRGVSFGDDWRLWVPDAGGRVEEITKEQQNEISRSDEPSSIVARLFGLPYLKRRPGLIEPQPNLVELLEGCDYNQSCRFGSLVDGHAVYCHNETWIDAPRKCRRTWYTGGRVKDETCPGYEPNERKEPM